MERPQIMDDETIRFRRFLERFGSPSEKRTHLTHKGKARSDRDNLKKVSDLSRFNNQLVLGGPPECPQRPFCQPGLRS